MSNPAEKKQRTSDDDEAFYESELAEAQNVLSELLSKAGPVPSPAAAAAAAAGGGTAESPEIQDARAKLKAVKNAMHAAAEKAAMKVAGRSKETSHVKKLTNLSILLICTSAPIHAVGKLLRFPEKYPLLKNLGFDGEAFEAIFYTTMQEIILHNDKNGSANSTDCNMKLLKYEAESRGEDDFVAKVEGDAVLQAQLAGIVDSVWGRDHDFAGLAKEIKAMVKKDQASK